MNDVPISDKEEDQDVLDARNHKLLQKFKGAMR